MNEIRLHHGEEDLIIKELERLVLEGISKMNDKDLSIVLSNAILTYQISSSTLLLLHKQLSSRFSILHKEYKIIHLINTALLSCMLPLTESQRIYESYRASVSKNAYDPRFLYCTALLKLQYGDKLVYDQDEIKKIILGYENDIK